MPSLSSQPERKKVFNTALARVKTTLDKSFILLVPVSCSSRSVMFWVRFRVGFFPLSEQEHPALADTACAGSRAETELRMSWRSQEQAGTTYSRAGWVHPIPHQREFLFVYLSKPRILNSFSSLPFLHQFFLKNPILSHASLPVPGLCVYLS